MVILQMRVVPSHHPHGYSLALGATTLTIAETGGRSRVGGITHRRGHRCGISLAEKRVVLRTARNVRRVEWKRRIFDGLCFALLDGEDLAFIEMEVAILVSAEFGVRHTLVRVTDTDESAVCTGLDFNGVVMMYSSPRHATRSS